MNLITFFKKIIRSKAHWPNQPKEIKGRPKITESEMNRDYNRHQRNSENPIKENLKEIDGFLDSYKPQNLKQ